MTFSRMPRPLYNAQRFVVAVAFLLLASGTASSGLAIPMDQAAQGWIQLFDGSSHFGWTFGGADWQVSGGAFLSDPSQQSWLRTTTSFSDFDLKFEARITGGPATLLFRADPQSKPAQPGYVLSLSDGTISGISGNSPSSVSSGWNSYEVQAQGTHLVVSVNGKITADGKNPKNRVGYFEFASPRGTRLEVRSILLKPLGLDSLYNGSNLDGWRSTSAPAPKKSGLKLPIPGLSGKPKPPQNVRWSGQGTIHGQDGIGQLESASAYDDFVMQFTVKATSKEGHSGGTMFFRGIANQFDSGYAIDLDGATSRELQDGKSFGTGGLIKLERSRVASVAAGQYFICTVVARAHRLSVWVNGVLAMDYYDSRPEGLYHSAAGPLGFRIQNDKATLDLRDIKIATLPKGPEPPPAPAPVPVAVAQPAAAPPGAPPAPVPVIMPGQSPQEKAQQEQIRKLTVDALAASTPEEAVQINKQILVLDPGDMPAQQRLDKAQSQIDAANAQREHGRQEQAASAAQMEANSARRSALLSQTQDALLRGDPVEARDRLNDAQRLGAHGPEVERLQRLILSRLRNRLLLRIGLGGGGAFACIALILFFWRRRGKTMLAYLVALDGVDKGKRYLLNQEITHIGGVAMDGGKKNEILVRDPDRQVSRFHCEVHKRGNSCYLIDLDSSNGTFLHNRPLQPGVAAKLRNGDRFILARTAAFEMRLERQK